MRWAMVMVLVVVALLGARSHANACSCAVPPAPAEALAQAEAVFEGEVLASFTDGPQGTTRTWRFRVLRAWKGVSADTIVDIRTATNSAACGYEEATFSLGATLLIYAYNADGLMTNICTRTRVSSAAADDFAMLGPPSSVSVGGIPPQTDAGTDAAGVKGTSTGNSQGCTVAGAPSRDGWSQSLAVALGLLGFLATRTRGRRVPCTRA